MKKKISLDKLNKWNDKLALRNSILAATESTNGKPSDHLVYNQTLTLADSENIEKSILENPVLIIISRKYKRGVEVTSTDLECLCDFLNLIIPGFHHFIISHYPRISPSDYWLCVLVRCYFAPKEIAGILGLSPQLVAVKRTRLQERIFGNHGTAKEFDRKIQSVSD